MPFGYEKPPSWLREDDEFDPHEKPGSSDWFDLSGDVGFKKSNNRHDTFKVESLLGYGGYMDLEKSGGPLGLTNWGLEKPIKKFQEKNGLEVDGWLKPGGPTITKMKQLYGGAFGKTPAPTPAMVDAHAEVIHWGEDGFLNDTAPKLDIRPNKRLDAKTDAFDYERWNREWARGAKSDPASYVPEYESYIRQIEPTHGHDPGLVYARDFAQKVEKMYGVGGKFTQRMLAHLADRPDLQQAFLGGPIPTHPPIGTFKDGGEERIKAWIDQDRIANGVAPKYAKLAIANTTEQADAPNFQTSAGSPPAPSEPAPKNLVEYIQNFGWGTPEDRAVGQRQPEQKLPEDGLPPDHVSPHKPTPSEHEDIDIDGENNSRRGPTGKEIEEARDKEREAHTECRQIATQLPDANNVFYDAETKLSSLKAQERNLELEIAGMKTRQESYPVPSHRPDLLGPHRDQGQPTPPPTQSPPQSPGQGVRIGRRGRVGAPPTRPPNAPPQQTRPPNADDAANQLRDAGLTAAEARQWQEQQIEIERKEAELADVKARIPAAEEVFQRADAAVSALERRSESLGCGRFNADRGGNESRPAPARE